ncbi:MAG: hypothetical protein AB1556_14445 [Bacillota bacterium]
MMLFSTVYHHHKVRAAECLFRSIFEELRKSKGKIGRLSFESAVDFLYLSDVDIYGLSKTENTDRVKILATDLCLRRLPKRAMVLSNKTVTTDSLRHLQKLMEMYEDPKIERMFIEAISEVSAELGQAVSSEDIWVDMRSGPKFKEAISWPIKSLGAQDGHVRLRDIMPIDDWVKAFVQNKWRGYIFTRPELRETVHEASKLVLKKVYRIEVNEYARLLCKMD